MLNLIRCEFWKLKRKMFVQLVLAASFLFPIPLTAIIYYLNTAQDKYATKAAAFDALWQSVIGFGMLLLLPCILGIVAALLFFMERDNDTFKNLRTIPITSSQMVVAKCIVLLLFSVVFCISSTVACIFIVHSTMRCNIRYPAIINLCIVVCIGLRSKKSYGHKDDCQHSNNKHNSNLFLRSHKVYLSFIYQPFLCAGRFVFLTSFFSGFGFININAMPIAHMARTLMRHSPLFHITPSVPER